MTKILPLFPDQKASLAFESKNDRVFDMSEPGTGKTRVRLEAFGKRRARKGKCALVLAPKSILDVAWEADCKTFTPWLKLQTCFAENRAKAFATPADIYVTNHDAVKWLAKQPPKFFEKFDHLIVDESGAFKHHTSQRSKALAKIKKYFPVRIAMNGTPNTNTVLDLWNQAFIIDDGKRLGQSFYAFRGVVCTAEQVGPKAQMLKWKDKDGASTVVADLLKDITIRNTLQGLPANSNYTREFKLSGKHMDTYKEMERDAIVFLKTGKVQAINAAAVVTKLLQIASGAVYDGLGNYHVVDTGRYELVADLIEERTFSVVFFIWRHQRDLLIEEFLKRGLTYVVVDGDTTKKARKEATELFQAGFYRVMLAQPQSAAHGFTWTKGVATIWPSPTYNLEHWKQGNHRIHRKGQTFKTETINVIAPGTIEPHVYSRLKEKDTSMTELLTYFEEVA